MEEDDDEECNEEGVAGYDERDADDCWGLATYFSRCDWMEENVRKEWKMMPASRTRTLIFASASPCRSTCSLCPCDGTTALLAGLADFASLVGAVVASASRPLSLLWRHRRNLLLM